MNRKEKIIRELKENEVDSVSFLSVDLKGRLHLLTIPANDFNEKIIDNGLGFDASSYGFAEVEKSDMVIKPDLSKYFYDPFSEGTKNVIFFTTIHYADDKRTRYENDPRYIAIKIEKAMKAKGIADTIYMAPEYEFYILEEVEYFVSDGEQYYSVQTAEGNSPYKKYHIAKPEDIYFEFRNEVTKILMKLGVPVKYHHHEVGSWGQQEIEVHLQPLLEASDNSIIVKYVLKNYSAENGLSITFMPKPFKELPGNGLHIHQFVSKNGKNIFYDQKGYGKLSKEALYYIGGILSNINSLVAITNPSTNSYKRLVPGFEAPTGINFGVANRNSAIRIPAYVKDPEKVRIEFRTPDFTANPYIAFSAIALAGIWGIENKVDPIKKGFGPAEGTKKKYKEIVPSFEDALNCLKKNNKFLLTDGGFSKGFLDSYIKFHEKEVVEIGRYPTPVEYFFYFDL